jgi:hypothetical protein
MMLATTVAIQHSIPSNNQKQFERMMQGVECKRDFEVWLRIEED